MCVGPFGVGSRDLKEGTLLTHHENVHNVSDVIAVSRPQNQEVRLPHFMEVDRSTEKIVLKGLGAKKKKIRIIYLLVIQV